VAYGLASLSCTLPVVFAVVGVGVGSTGTMAAAIRLVAFAAGVAFVLAVITVVAGVLGTRTLRTWRRFGSIVPTIGGILLLFSGAYTAYYWLTIGRELLV
jgi:cytochrome c biogenesis protein CcdA